MTNAANADAYARGAEYLRAMQRLLPDPAMIDVMENLRDRTTICTWIGTHIQTVNEALYGCLLACHECFHPPQRRLMQIFAIPLSQPFGLDGLCNLTTTPITILVDVGRVAPPDWLRLVVHEYAHAHTLSPGHHPDFAATLCHLCLGLGLEIPGSQTEWALRQFPPYTPTLDALAFWRGEIFANHFYPQFLQQD